MESDPQRVKRHLVTKQSSLACLREFWSYYFFRSSFLIPLLFNFSKFWTQILLLLYLLFVITMAYSAELLLVLVRLPTYRTRVSLFLVASAVQSMPLWEVSHLESILADFPCKEETASLQRSLLSTRKMS